VAKRQKRVFILGGGAALGAHHVGALKYLDEEGIKPDAIVGSSIGVINACVYASGGVPQLESAWREMRSAPLIFAPHYRDNPLFGRSLFSMNRLSATVEEFIDFPKIFESRLDLEFIVLNLSRGRGEVYSKRDCERWRDLRTLSRAGYAIPILFPPVQFRGDWFVDGGFAWNIPLEHALGLGATEIFLLAPIASQLPYQGRFGSMLGFVQRFGDVMWRTIGNMGYLYARMERGRLNGVPVTVIEPGEQYSGFGPLHVFNAYPRKNRALMEAGYRDAKRVIAARRRLEEQDRAEPPAPGRARTASTGRAGRVASRTARRVANAVEGTRSTAASSTGPEPGLTVIESTGRATSEAPSSKVVALRATEPRGPS
jgi:predicted acylesterase/phospholipase RssA